MKLKENVWYIIDKEHDRNEFIDDLCCATRIMRTQMIAQHPEVQTAKVIKYKQKCYDPIIFDINYRTEFKPDYLQGPREHYEPMCKDLSSFRFIDNSTIKEWVDAKIHESILNGTVKDTLKPPTINMSYEPRDMTEDIMTLREALNKTKLYKGENTMNCSNEYNEKYLIQQHFNAEEKKLTDERNQAENDLLKNTALYKAAEAFILEVNANKCYKCAPNIRYLIKDYLTDVQKDALNKLTEKYNEEVEEIRKKCKVVESLINMCDNADQKMDILRRYEIIKLPKMPK